MTERDPTPNPTHADLVAAIDTARCALSELEELAECVARAMAALALAIRHADEALPAPGTGPGPQGGPS